MTKHRLPTLFVSHGAPDLTLTDNPTKRFLSGLGQWIDATYGRPKAVVCVSAHWETSIPCVSGTANPDIIYDFFGFAEEFYHVTYPCPGAPDVAQRIARLCHDEGLVCEMDRARGIDHGVYVPMGLMYRQADVPLCQLSVQPAGAADAAQHLALGRALATLREDGILVLGSGGAVHDLRYYKRGSTDVEDWAYAFDTWLRQVIETGDTDRLVNYLDDAAPDAAKAHPRDEHFLPLPVVMGAAGAGVKGRILHDGFMDGSLSMAAYAFD